MSRAHRLLAGLLAAGALALTGCAQSVDPIERLGRKAAQKVEERRAARAEPGLAGPGAHQSAERRKAGAHQSAERRKSGFRERAVSTATARRWGLDAPLAPAPKPRLRRAHAMPGGPGLPPVVDRVPTKDKVVFLTFDDAVERDPRFVRMVRELKLPVSVFLTDRVLGPGYAHFGELRAVGATVQNHTLDHPYLPGLSYEGQRWEICGQQDKLKQRFGIRPRLFRPPYGEYDDDTLRAAADCGIAAVVRWRTTLRLDGHPDADGPELAPGDIVLAQHPGPADPDGASLTEATARLLRTIQAQGYTVARLEDYL
ncbi:polysaccharide deacetylase family protein [Streptomyces sp. Da 82-17]|uniref:polysaccharide deacetylase family protein n=1 Tax=Streptomyces sp. Da 82-17 TaxID=3377116 RepID=UPI0038D38682